MQRIGRYEILEELGRGAMGVVYRARDTQIGRIVALKIILTKSGPPAEVEHYKQRFQREAQAAGRLSHPGIVTLHDIAVDSEGQPYIVMEFIEGQPLNHLLSSPADKNLDHLLEIAIQVARALDYAHHAGVVHRDIKPENIMITRDGRAKITDFGIAKVAGAELTQEGMSLGTPSYMSPEQIRGSTVDARADIFSLGAVLYWMCTGQKPFTGDSVTTITFRVVFQDPAGPHTVNPNLPPDLDRVLSRCLAKNPADRYLSCAELAGDLEALRAGRPLAPVRPAVSAPSERTQAMPVASQPSVSIHNDTTLPLDAPTERARPIPTILVTAPTVIAPAADSVAPPSGARLLWLTAASAVILAAVIGGAFWLRRQPPVNSPATSATTPPHVFAATQPPSGIPGSAPEDSPAVPVSPASTPASAQRAAAAATMLRVVCHHNFRIATLEVYVDNALFYRANLQGKEVRHIVKHYEGTFEDKRPIPVGHHTLRVRVFSFREKYDDQEAVSGEFPEAQPRTLVIEFGKGSGLGVTDRNLDLTLR